MSRAVAPSNTDDLQSWLQDMVKQLAFTRLIAAIVALVTRLRDLNTELTEQLANLRRARPARSGFAPSRVSCFCPGRRSRDQASRAHVRQRRRRGRVARNGAGGGALVVPRKRGKRRKPDQERFPAAIERIPLYNGVPRELRRCPKCGIEMAASATPTASTSTSFRLASSSCGRTDKALKCRLDATIISALPPARIVERGVLVPIDFALYMPKSWTEDSDRREKAKVPADLVFKTKPELALELIARAIEDNVLMLSSQSSD